MLPQWDPLPGLLFTAGSCSHMRVWDVQREQCVARVPVCAKRQCITTIATPWPGVGVALVGSSTGAVTMVDVRMPQHAGSTAWYVLLGVRSRPSALVPGLPCMLQRPLLFCHLCAVNVCVLCVCVFAFLAVSGAQERVARQ
jgi:hypothetical protein